MRYVVRYEWGGEAKLLRPIHIALFPSPLRSASRPHATGRRGAGGEGERLLGLIEELTLGMETDFGSHAPSRAGDPLQVDQSQTNGHGIHAQDEHQRG